MNRYIQANLKTALDKIEVVFQPKNVEVFFQIFFFKTAFNQKPCYLTSLDIVKLT